MTWPTTLPTFTAGQVVPESALDDIVAALHAIGDAWITYTPTAGGGLTVGNGTLNAAYSQAGKTVTVRISLTLGSTSAIVGNISLTLPVAPIASIDQALSAWVNDASAGATGRLPAVGAIPAGAGAVQVWSTGGSLSATVPFTWASTDKITITGTYEAA